MQAQESKYGTVVYSRVSSGRYRPRMLYVYEVHTLPAEDAGAPPLPQLDLLWRMIPNSALNDEPPLRLGRGWLGKYLR